MNLSRPFILRPVATTLLMVALLLSGVLAYRLLPVAALPQVDYPIIQITTLYPGASPELTTRTITAPLERQLGQIPGLKQLSSTSSGGASVITLQFGLEVSLGVAEQDVQAAINAAGSFLPGDLPVPPVYRKVNPADTPILTLAVTSQGLSLPQVHDLVDTRIAQRLAQLPGVGLVSLAGGQRPAVRIQVNPAALAANNLGMDHIRTAIAAANVNLPKGSFDGPIRAVMLDANDQMRSVDEYRALVLAWRDGAPLRLGDVATITDGAENRQLAAWSGTTPAVLVNIQRQPGANVIAVVEQVRTLLPQLQATLPAGVQMNVLSDRTESIRASVRGVQKELVLAIGLVVLVTWVFLRNLPATLIPSVAVPLSLIGTFAVMLLAGYSLNNLTLMALTIATGFVVDDAIVMLENIARHLEEGESPRDAALKGAAEIGFTLVSLTVSLIAVLIPLLFMADLVGALFHEFAVTLAVAIGISLVVSLTLTPMLCARLLKPHAKTAHAPDVFDRVISLYDRQLRWVLQRQPLMLLATVATLALTVALYFAVPKGFFPVQDAGLVQGISEAPQAISFQAMRERQQALAAAIEADEAVASVSSYIGVDGNNATLNTGRLLIELKPHGDRDGAAVVMARLQQRVSKIPGITLYLQPVQELGIEDRISRTQYQFTLTTPDLETLERWTPEAAAGATPATSTARCRQRSADAGSAGTRGDRPRCGGASGRKRGSGSRCAVRRLRAAPDFDHLHPGQPVPGGAGSRSFTTARAAGDHGPACAQQQRADRAAGCGGTRGSGPDRPAAQPCRPVPGGDAVVQPRTGRVAGRSGGGCARRTRTRGSAAEHRAAPAGGRSGVQQFTVLHTVADPGCGGGDVHRAGRALRELHPPHHHPLHLALGHRRCAGGTVGKRTQPGPDRGDRHRAADRPGEEERDHDDRLRAGRAAHTRHVTARGDPSGCAAALPADSDDHAGRAVRRSAADAGQWFRRRTAAATGLGDGGGASGQPGTDPVHHAGDLPGL